MLQKRLKYSDEQVLFCFKKGGLVAEKNNDCYKKL